MDLVNEIVLESGIAILSGGKTKGGTPLLTIPTDATDLFEIYATVDIARLLQFYVTLAAGDNVSVIAELSREWTDDCVSKLSTILNELQLKTRRLKEAYLVKTDNPKEKLDFSKYRSTALTIHECQVIFLDSHEELHALVDMDQLTPDYGGTLQYNHRCWVDFHKAYYPIIDEASSTKTVLSDISRCVSHALGKRRDVLDGTDALDTFATVRNKKAVFLDLELERVLEDGQESLEKLQHPEFDPTLVKLPAGFLNNAVATLNDNLVGIKELSELVMNQFEEMETEINVYHSLKECKYQVEEVVETICLMRQEAEDLPDIGTTSWEAFHNRQDFIKHILTPSKEIADCADSVLADLHAVGMKTGSSSRTRTMESQLKAELESFSRRINQLNEAYVRLHLFYVIFDKAKRWLNSLVQHLEKHPNKTPTQRNDLHIEQDTNTCAKDSGKKGKTPPTQNMCHARLKRFLQKHPAPKEQHLLLMSKYVPSSVQSNHIHQAQALAKKIVKHFNSHRTRACNKCESPIPLFEDIK